MSEWYQEASDAIREDMIALSDSLFSHPELGYEEFASSEDHAAMLRKYGFTVEKPYLGLETGYRATYDSGKPAHEASAPEMGINALDAGNVSYVCPTIHPYFPIGTDTSVANHTREFAACTQTDFAKDNMMTAAQAMALAGYRVITEPETLKKIRDEFEAMPK